MKGFLHFFYLLALPIALFSTGITANASVPPIPAVNNCGNENGIDKGAGRISNVCTRICTTPKYNTANFAVAPIARAAICDTNSGAFPNLLLPIKCHARTKTMFAVAVIGTKTQKGGAIPMICAMTGEIAATLTPTGREQDATAIIKMKFIPLPVTNVVVGNNVLEPHCHPTKSAISSADCVIQRILLFSNVFTPYFLHC